MDKLNKFAEELRLEFSEWTVPNFDPKDGGVNAKILFLLEKPGPETENSGLISQDNDDETARATKEFLNDAGVADYQIVDSQGATEGTVKNKTAEAIADITSSGRTLMENHLKILDDGLILKSQTTLYGVPVSTLKAPSKDRYIVFLQKLAL